MLIPTPANNNQAVFPLAASYRLMPGRQDAQLGFAPLPGEENSPAQDKPLALVVDDAPDVTEMIGMLMRFAGYEVVAAFNAVDALDAARQTHFNVVVSDIGMPGMSGYELAEALRTLPDYGSVPMIAVTGFATYDDRERAVSSGFNDCLTKPINPMDLIDLVKRLRG